HKFANEIIFRLGGGIQGIAESKIVFVSTRSGHKEIWEMDYDGQNQHQLTRMGSVALSPRISPDGSRITFSALTKTEWDILMYSLDLNRTVSFPRFGGMNLSPAWSADGMKLAFSSSRTSDPEIYVVDGSGGNLKRITNAPGPDVSPVWNPKTNAQIAWVSGRTGLPQIYTMEADGTTVQRMPDKGYAVSPAWSPNGQFLAVAWIRKYGPGEPGASDIYLMDIASKQWVQLTDDGGRNDFPSWSPDGRHLIFQSNRSGSLQIWTMLADGTKQTQLTSQGTNSQPNWSWKSLITASLNAGRIAQGGQGEARKDEVDHGCVRAERHHDAGRLQEKGGTTPAASTTAAGGSDGFADREPQHGRKGPAHHPDLGNNQRNRHQYRRRRCRKAQRLAAGYAGGAT